MRIEQQLEAYSRLAKTPLGDARANVHASFPAEPTLALLGDLCDLFDRVTILERTLRRMIDRLEFLGNVSRMLGHEDWGDLGLDDRTPAERGERVVYSQYWDPPPPGAGVDQEGGGGQSIAAAAGSSP